jgi:hypothetical protein
MPVEGTDPAVVTVDMATVPRPPVLARFAVAFLLMLPGMLAVAVGLALVTR